MGRIVGKIISTFSEESPVVIDPYGKNVLSSTAPVFFYENVFNRYFLGKLLDIDLKTRTIRYGYFYKGSFYLIPTEKIFKLYLLKTRGEIIQKPLPSKTQFKIYDVSAVQIYRILEGVFSEKIRKRIVKIDVESKEIRLEDGEILTYQRLFSTIPAPVFYHLSGFKKKFRFRPIKFRVEPRPKGSYDEFFDYIYYPGDEPFYRIYFNRLNNVYVHEYINDFGENVVKYGKILPPYGVDIKYFRLKDVFFIGRHGKWKEEYYIHDGVRDCLKILSEF